MRRRTLLLLASGMGIAAMIAKICIMSYSIVYEWFPFDSSGNRCAGDAFRADMCCRSGAW